MLHYCRIKHGISSAAPAMQCIRLFHWPGTGRIKLPTTTPPCTAFPFAKNPTDSNWNAHETSHVVCCSCRLQSDLPHQTSHITGRSCTFQSHLPHKTSHILCCSCQLRQNCAEPFHLPKGITALDNIPFSQSCYLMHFSTIAARTGLNPP
jgi:hypothetical protein